jgi:hypothetical protein
VALDDPALTETRTDPVAVLAECSQRSKAGSTEVTTELVRVDRKQHLLIFSAGNSNIDDPRFGRPC